MADLAAFVARALSFLYAPQCPGAQDVQELYGGGGSEIAEGARNLGSRDLARDEVTAINGERDARYEPRLVRAQKSYYIATF